MRPLRGPGVNRYQPPQGPKPPEPPAKPKGRPLFPLGQLVSTPGALEALMEAHISTMDLVDRHVRGDWGDLPEEDVHSNEQALVDESRILSRYVLPTKEIVWIITEADRSSTCLLLPEEY